MEMDTLKAVKRERLNTSRAEQKTRQAESTQSSEEDTVERRVLRSKYLAVMKRIKDKRDDLVKPNSEKFNVIIDEVETLHRQVQKPREQVADAEALLGMVNTLASSVKTHSSGGITPSDFVMYLFRDFGQSHMEFANLNSLRWKDIGLAVSSIFMNGHGCRTMIGPMSDEMKIRQTRPRSYRKRTRPTETAHPEKLDNTRAEKSDTDKNMSTMFEILKKKRSVVLEILILNRSSFAQTVENLFALSFLVKDGRAEGSHLVSPKNAPDAALITSREVNYNHFVFRFDFKDWKVMRDLVPNGEELMPHRSVGAENAPIRKLSRNRGLVVQEASVVEQCPQGDYDAAMKLLPLVAVVSSSLN